MDLIYQGSLSQVAYVAAELGVVDNLTRGPRRVAELAAATGARALSLRRLLRALASLEVCRERRDGRFALGPAGRLLSIDAPDSLAARFLYWGRCQWPLWGNLLHSVKTGGSARKLIIGTDGFEHLQGNADAAAIFNQSRVDLTRIVAREVVRAYDFAGLRSIVDVGGGHGALLAVILQAHPLFDMGHAMEGAKAHLSKAGLAARSECIAGNFFKSVPPGADGYVLKSVIHDWNDERSGAILRKCRKAIRPDGRLLLVERIMPERLKPLRRHHAFAQADLAMLLGPGGRERTETEFRRLLGASGFKLTRIIKTQAEHSIIEAAAKRFNTARG
jgi:hypothetical protein